MSNQDNKKEFQDIFTHVDMVNELLDYIPLKTGDNILEPTAGSGNMVIPIIHKCNDMGISVNITANEIQEKHILEMIERLEQIPNVSINRQEPEVDIFDVFF
jgi:16S rRNA A1518/A1519 N6-dimethyltransferase RsmA/KsgA/DIM1 with predicted DNA glycosylase/AP lyase activity